MAWAAWSSVMMKMMLGRSAACAAPVKRTATNVASVVMTSLSIEGVADCSGFTGAKSL